MLNKILKYKIYIIVLIIVVIGFLIFNKSSSNIDNNINSNITDNNDIINNESEENISYYANIEGEILNPGVYEISDNMRIIDLIKIAGGLTDNADISLLNLSKKVSDENYIKIYSKEEVKNAIASIKKDQVVVEPKVIIKEIEKECICPTENNNACINEYVEDSVNNEKKLININTATTEELMTIPGIGESKAISIIEYRNSTVFNNIEDILNVSGIGKSIFEKIKDYITV